MNVSPRSRQTGAGVNRPRRNRLPARPGLSLLELLVSIGVIAILIGIAIPVLSSAREAARSVECKANLRSLHTAIVQYRHDHRNTLPYADIRISVCDGWRDPLDALAPYLAAPTPHCASETELRAASAPPWRCPTDPGWHEATGVSYEYGPWEMIGISGAEAITQVIETSMREFSIFHDLGPWHSGKRNKVRLDGAIWAEADRRRRE